jgi:uncharacterized protein YdeI (YjbR/CyaY-like superfamily)
MQAMPKIVNKEMRVRAFPTQQSFEIWLGKNHESIRALWIRFFKKGSNKKTITYAEAVDVALCYGWIDSQLKTYDAESYIQKFTPRGPKSIWSKINTERVTRLLKEKRMQPSGITQVTAAKKDGRWDLAYDSSKNMSVPEDFLSELQKHKKAFDFFKTLSKANIYAIAWRLRTVKTPETRSKREKSILEMLNEGKSFH